MQELGAKLISLGLTLVSSEKFSFLRNICTIPCARDEQACWTVDNGWKLAVNAGAKLEDFAVHKTVAARKALPKKSKKRPRANG